MQSIENVIIGGGISGLACARTLHQHHVDFRLITKRVGGRMTAAGDALWNLGASYVTSDYRHVGPFIGRRERIRRRNVWFRLGNRFVTIYHPWFAQHWPALIRLIWQLRDFHVRLNVLRGRCETISQAVALESDAVLSKYVAQPAVEFLAKHRLEPLNDLVLNAIVNSTVFLTSDRVSTFNFLDCLLPILLPTYVADFRGTVKALTRGWEQQIATGEVRKVERLDTGLFLVTTDDEEVQARRVIMACPPSVASTLCGEWPQEDLAGVDETSKHVLLVRGRRRENLCAGKIVFLAPGQTTTVLFRNEVAQADVLFTDSANPDLSDFYEEYRIAARRYWQPAIVLAKSSWRDLEPVAGMLAIGDRNKCGLEDSYLTGLCAARHILTGAGHHVPLASRTGLTGSPVR